MPQLGTPLPCPAQATSLAALTAGGAMAGSDWGGLARLLLPRRPGTLAVHLRSGFPTLRSDHLTFSPRWVQIQVLFADSQSPPLGRGLLIPPLWGEPK